MSAYLSRAWAGDLAAVTGKPFAYTAIALIALGPGFVNMLLVVSLLLDRQPQLSLDHEYPAITILMAAYNEQDIILETLRGIAGQDYPAPIKIVAVDDGSEDRTVELLEHNRLPNMRVISASHGGKAAALNTGMAEAATEILVTMDADTFLHPQALRRIVARFLQDPPNTAAVAGSVMAKNSRSTRMARLQEYDYFLAIASVKRQQGLYQGTLVAQGAFSLYRKSLVSKARGWPNVVGEDIVLTWALIKEGARIGYEPTAIGFTNVPENFRHFVNQRRRWARGMIEGFKNHFNLIYRRRSLASLLVAMNLLYPPFDAAYTLLFIPGIALALTGRFWLVGPMTLTVLPLNLTVVAIMFHFQKHVFELLNLKVRRNRGGFLLYILIYQAILSPVALMGYLEELLGRKKMWRKPSPAEHLKEPGHEGDKAA